MKVKVLDVFKSYTAFIKIRDTVVEVSESSDICQYSDELSPPVTILWVTMKDFDHVPFIPVLTG